MKTNKKRIFLMGKQSNIPYNITTEQEINQDILQADFEESFNNLTYKDYILLNWLKSEDCKSKYVITKHMLKGCVKNQTVFVLFRNKTEQHKRAGGMCS